jgi:hypothetical protein
MEVGRLKRNPTPKGKYQFVEACYVHDIMDGEVLNEAAIEKVVIKQFELKKILYINRFTYNIVTEKFYYIDTFNVLKLSKFIFSYVDPPLITDISSDTKASMFERSLFSRATSAPK